MSTLRAVETFDFLLKHDNAKKKRRKVIRVVVIIVVILILLIGSAALLKSFVIDKNSNDSTRPPYKPNDTTSNDKLEQNSEVSKEISVCKVIQLQDDKLTPCSFPFVIAGQTFYNCTGK